MTTRPLSEPTFKSLLLTLFWKNPEGEYKKLSTGTGFVVQHRGLPYLITNRHVLTGANSSGDPLSKHGVYPSHVRIAYSSELFIERRVVIQEALYTEEEAQIGPRWVEHPTGPTVDVVALPISRVTSKSGKGIKLYPYTVSTNPNEYRPYLRPSDAVSIVGFPFGIVSQRHFAVWTRGSVASEPEFDYDRRPAFLVDARTRPGQSGSPVLVHLSLNTPPLMFTDFSVRTYTAEKSFLLGVYSGRVNKKSDLGIVWKTVVISEILGDLAP